MSPEKFSSKALKILTKGQTLAGSKKHTEILPEHILSEILNIGGSYFLEILHNSQKNVKWILSKIQNKLHMMENFVGKGWKF